MQARGIKQIIQTRAISEGAGVTVHRSIGTAELRNLDPFLMLDFFSSDDPDDYIAGFPDHPHRGFITLTYMLAGHMLHQDSMGNKGDLRSGGAQWMKAASGVIHSEMPQQSDGLMQGFQLWINLPASEKMSAPAYQEFAPEAIPEFRDGTTCIRVLSGQYAGVQGVIDDPYTDVQYLDIQLAPDTDFQHDLNRDYQGFIYLIDGSAQLQDSELQQHQFAVLGPGDQLQLRSGSAGVRLIVVAGRPIGEPIVQYGPFVMNSPEEIHQAMADYRDGALVQQKASWHQA